MTSRRCWGTAPPSPLDEADPRTDYEMALDWMVEHRIAPGQTVRYPDPAGHITRAEAITVLHGLAAVSKSAPERNRIGKDIYPERELVTERPPFPDVADGAWYGEAVDWATTQGIVWWLPPDPFHPDQVVTRSEAAVYLHRFHDPSTPTPTTQPESSEPWL